MKESKFWLFQIIMIAILSLVLGSPVLADYDDDDRSSHQNWLYDDDDHDDLNDDDDDDDDDDEGGSTVPPDPNPSECPQGTSGTPPNCI